MGFSLTELSEESKRLRSCTGVGACYRLAMGKGQWTRWGRGSAEGYNFEIGDMLRYGVMQVRAIGGNRYEDRLNAEMLVRSFTPLYEAKVTVEAHARQEMSSAQVGFTIFLKTRP